MPGATYEVALELTTKGDLSSKLDGMVDSLGGLSDGMSGLGATMGDIFTGAIDKVASLGLGLAKIAAIGVGGALSYGVGKLNADLEKTQVSLAAIFNANGAANGMADGMEISAKQMAAMRKEAAELPGEFSDLVGIFRASAIPGLRAGMSIDQIRALAANTMAAGAASGLEMPMVAREMGMLLSGRAGAHNVLGSQIFGLSGDSAKKFNEMDASKRVEVLNKQLLKFGEAKAMFGTTWEGITSTMVDNGKAILGAATLPLFNSVKTALGQVNSYFDSHQSNIMTWAKNTGLALQDGFQKGLALVTEWWPTMINFATVFEVKFLGVWTKLEPIVERIAGHVGNMLKDPEGLTAKMEQMGVMYGATKGAPLVSSAVSGMGEAAGLGGAASGAVALAAVALALVDIAAIAHVVTDSTGELYDYATVAWTEIKANMGTTLDDLTSAFTRLAPYGLKLADAFGMVLLMELDGAVWAVSKLASGVAYLAEVFIGIVHFIESKIGAVKDLLGIGLKAKLDNQGDVDPYTPNRTGPEVMSSAYMGALGTVAVIAAKKTVAEAPKGHGVHVDKVEITISGQTDPSRVARIVQKHLTNLAQGPKTSRFSPQYSGSK